MGPGFVRRDVRRAVCPRPQGLQASMGPGFVRRDVLPYTLGHVYQVISLQWGPASSWDPPRGGCPVSPRPGSPWLPRGGSPRLPGADHLRRPAVDHFGRPGAGQFGCPGCGSLRAPGESRDVLEIAAARPSGSERASMGPGFVRRDVRRTRPATPSKSGTRFNGARLRSPGCAARSGPAVPWGPVASMGPGFVRRDVPRGRRGRGSRPGRASMGPGFVRRDVHIDAIDLPADPLAVLQWGPASFAGMCAVGAAELGPRVAASMGPGFVRRDVPDGLPHRGLLHHASMGPGFVRRDVPGAHEGRTKGARGASMGPGFVRRDVRRDGRSSRRPLGASMGPGFVRRDVRPAPRRARAGGGCFNGARLRSPGCALLGPAVGVRRRAASMGPGFVRRDVPANRGDISMRSALLQWGPASFAGMCRVESGLQS